MPWSIPDANRSVIYEFAMDRLDSAIDEAQASLRPLFDTVNGAGAYHLPLLEQDLTHEIMFKPGMLRSVIIHRDEPAHGVHSRWLDAQALRERARRKIDDQLVGDTTRSNP